MKYRVAAKGDFNGDGLLDLVWTSDICDEDVPGNIRHSARAPKRVLISEGWSVAGSGDVDGNGGFDMVYGYLTGVSGKFDYWATDGAVVKRARSVKTGVKCRVAATGGYDGDGLLDIVWTSNSRDIQLWFGNEISFSSSAYAGYYSVGWSNMGP